MPRLRRRAKGRRGSTVPGLYRLLVGDASRNVNYVGSEWSEWCDLLVPYWRLWAPGTRPWAWWEHDAPEKTRRCIDGPGSHYLAEHEHAPGYNPTKVSFGLPTCLSGWDFKNPSRYETELEYLGRLDLLEDGEKDAALAISPLPWEPDDGCDDGSAREVIEIRRPEHLDDLALMAQSRGLA